MYQFCEWGYRQLSNDLCEWQDAQMAACRHALEMVGLYSPYASESPSVLSAMIEEVLSHV